MRRIVILLALVILLSLTVAVVSAQEALCTAELEIMTTADGVEFVRTPDACFEDLPDWPYEAQYVEIDGLRQGYVDVGPADAEETILLLHGQPSWSYLYREMIPVLADAGHRVIAMDHLGMGRSDKPIDPDYYSYLGHVDRLEDFIQELALENITLFAQDWGSLIGLYVVGTNPDWFDRVVVGNGFLPVWTEGTVPFELPENPQITRQLFFTAITSMPAQQSAFYDAEGNRIASPISSGGEEYFGIWIDYSRNDERFVASQIVEAMTYFDLSPEEEAAYNAPFPSRIAMAGPRAFPGLTLQMPGVTQEAWDGLGQFEQPFLTIWGGNDPGNLGQPAVQQGLLDFIPGTDGWDHARLPEASHFLQDDQGEEIARRINEFIAQTAEDDEMVAADDTANEQPQVGFEIHQIVSPNEIVTWANGEMTQAEFDAIELPVGWFKNQPREVEPDGGEFARSPGATADGELVFEEHFGHLWMHVATITQVNLPLDEEGLLTGAYVSKHHQVSFDAGSTLSMIISPESDHYVRISRDAGRTNNTPTIPSSWQHVEYTIDEDLVIQLPDPTVVIRADNEDSFQGPIPQLALP